MDKTPEITPYQFEALCKTAQGRVPIFPVPLPTPYDSPHKRLIMRLSHTGLKQLVELALMEDVSEEFTATIRRYKRATGRDFAVYELTEVGYLLFKDCDSRLIN